MNPGPAGVADAYVWGYPLVVMHRTCAAHGGVGLGLLARDRLSTAADRSVVAPNNDTLYASGWFDLRRGDLTVDVEAMDHPGRYWSVMLLDAYTNVSYVSRRRYGTAGACVRVTYDPTTRPLADVSPAGIAAPTGGAEVPRPAPARQLAMGTPTVWVLARVLVDGPDDLPAARAAQARIHVYQAGLAAGAVTPAGRTGAGAPGAYVDLLAGRAEHDGRAAGFGASGAGGSGRRSGGFLEELRVAMAVDPPAGWHPAAPAGLDELLRWPPADDVVAEGIEAGRARVVRAVGGDRRGNGWTTRSRGADFGDDVAYRAAFAQVSLAGHLPVENRSYTRPFDGSAPATLRFAPGDEPPVDGFWSLCLYGPALFFVDNEIDRYSIGERTAGLKRDDDGGLTATIGAEPPAGADGTANWLPAPAGPCFLALRAYEGRHPVVAADWFPPDLGPVA